MPARPLLPFGLALLVGTGAVLSACDFGGADGVSGRWVGTAAFEADTILAAHNAHVVADYETEFTFVLTDDEGLITGLLTAHTTGLLIVREAGQPADTLRFDDATPVVHDVFGTYLDPVLEVDVPGGPYEEGLWTFDVSGRRARSDNFLVHLHQIPLRSTGDSFEFSIRSAELFEMRRVADEE